MKQCYITITGLKHYYGKKPFRPGQSVRLVKEPGNPYDCEAIRVEMPVIGTVGYVANSSDTVFQRSAWRRRRPIGSRSRYLSKPSASTILSFEGVRR